MSIKTVAVAGGSGGIGSFVTSALLDAGFKVKVLTREAKDNSEKLKAKGAEIVVVDFEKVDSLTQALKGVDAVISTVAGAALHQPQLNLVEASKAAGVRRFVPSDFGVSPSSYKRNESALWVAKSAIHDAVKKAGLELTTYSVGLFIDTTFFDWSSLNLKSGKVSIPGDGNAKLNLTHRADVGKFVAATLNNPDAANKEYKYAGVTTTLNKVVAKAKALEHSVEASYQPVSDILAIINSNANPWGTVVEQLRFAIAEEGYFEPVDNSAVKFEPISLEKYLTEEYYKN